MEKLIVGKEKETITYGCANSNSKTKTISCPINNTNYSTRMESDGEFDNNNN